MENIVNALSQYVGPAIASLIGAVIILLVGWIIAALVARLVSALARRINLDKRIEGAQGAATGKGYPIEGWIGTLVFWFIFLFFVVGALQILGFTRIAEPINTLLATVTAWLPALVAAIILALIAHIVGSLVRRLVVGFMQKRNVDDRLASSSGVGSSVAAPIGDALYYLVWLLFLPAILGALGLESLLVPVQGMIDQFLSFLPKLAAAAILLIVGWFVARIIQRIVTGFLASVGVDRFAERVGMSKYMGSMTVSYLLGLIVFVIVLIPIVTAALDAVGLESLTVPLTAMITEVVSNIPNYALAVAILVVTFVLGRWLIGIAVEILSGLGVNSLPRVLGLSDTGSIGSRTLAQWIGDVLLLILMLLAAVQAAQVIGWDAVTVAIGALGSQVVEIVFGLIIIAIGLYLANLAGRFINGTTIPNRNVLGWAARIAIIAFAGAMGLTAMGFASEIVIIAFGLFMGAIAVAVALSFGLGGRETAGRQISEWAVSLKKGDADTGIAPAPPTPPVSPVPPVQPQR